MKNLLLIILLALLMGGCKKQQVEVSGNSKIFSQLTGNWASTKNVTIYTDSKGNQQEFNDGVMYTLSFNGSGSVTKKSGPYTTYMATYTTAVTNGSDYINFAVNSQINGTGSVVQVDTYKVVTLTSDVLVITTNPVPGAWTYTKNGVTTSGTNAYSYEAYKKQ